MRLYDFLYSKKMIKLSNNLLVLLSILAIPVIVQAAQVRLTASLDKTEATTEDTIMLTITVEGTQSTPQPVVPAVAGLNIRYSGSSSEFSVVNGVSSSSIKYNYIIFPLRAGSFTLAPAYIDYEGQKIKSQPIKFKILSAQSQPQQNKALFLKAEVSNTTPYYNEQILYTLQFGRMVNVAGANLDAASFKDFWTEELGEQKQYQRVIGGHTYLITEIKKALFPAKTGKLVIEPATISCEIIMKSKRRRSPFGDRLFDDFFSNSFFTHRTETRILHSQPIELGVKPLPEQGRPPNFHPLVGQLKVKTGSSKHILQVGDSTTLTIDISGNVNIRDAQLVAPQNLQDFKVYDDKPTINILKRVDKVIGQKIFKKALVPQKAGSLTVPSFEIPYFDPQTASYKVAHSQAVNLQVSPATEEETLHETILPGDVSRKEAIKILGRDILPIYTDAAALKDNRPHRRDYFIYIGLFLFPGLIYLTLLSLRIRQERHEKDISLLRKKNAYKKAMSNLGLISTVLKKGDHAEFYAEVSRTLKEYLGDKLNLPGAALTPQEAAAGLKAAGLDGDLIEQFKKLLEQCESCQFGSKSTEQTACQTIYKNTQQTLKQLEKLLRHNR